MELNKTIFVLLGASGSGKSTLSKYIRQKLGIKELISHTTRDMREGEIQDYTYHFVSEDEFDEHYFVEKVEYAGNKYGLSMQEVEDNIKNHDKLFIIMEKNGIHQLKEEFPEVNVEIVYIYATIDECINRMTDRSTKKIIERIKNSAKDKEFNNHDIADYIVRNKDLDKAKKQIKCIFS